MGERAYVTVVSGLPRSGTSLLMQMLAAGGLPPLCDETRPADLHNPRGYFELAAVRRIAEDASFVGAAVGRALKVVVPLARQLPPGYAYRVLLVRRDLAQVIASQDAMLAGAASPPGNLAELLAAQLEAFRAWAAERPGLRLLEVEHARLLAEPRAAAEEVSSFLDGLDVDAMAAAVAPELQRRR